LVAQGSFIQVKINAILCRLIKDHNFECWVYF
jgi:hypothetical protein